MRSGRFLCGLSVMLALAATPVRAETSVRVEPESILLSGANRAQHFLVTFVATDGSLTDRTHDCEASTADPAVAQVVAGAVVGVADGTTVLRIRVGTQVTEVPVRVSGIGGHPPVDFVNDIVPVLSKLGCNSGGCHGRASGQNGFKLSVFGFDAEADYEALVKEARGRRVLASAPERSLLLLKATATVPHGGGRRMETGSQDHRLWVEWIRQGVPAKQPTAPRLTGLRVSPTQRVLGLRRTQQVLVTAEYSDGSLRDVTDAAAYTGNAETVVEPSASGRLTVGSNPGEAAVTVQYMGLVDVVRIQVPRPRGSQAIAELPVANRIDELVGAKLRTMGIAPSKPSDDATFLRRLHIDAVGTLPTSAEVREFLADPSPDKRARLIDRLLAGEEYVDYWTLKWADILVVDRKSLGSRGAYEFHRWLRKQIAENRPYDQWVRELISASGNTGKYGPANFPRALRTPESLAKAVSQAFLGIRLECAQCHHHPFERWGQADFYGMAGFFSGLERRVIDKDRELILHSVSREMKVPLSERPAPTRAPGGPPVTLPADTDPRPALAEWMTARDNPWFARLAVNRLWKHYMGRGLVEPEDDLRSTNPATNEPLLRFLETRFVESGYDLKAVARLILNSRAYQLSSQAEDGNRDDEQNHSHRLVRRLPAEVLLDAICAVTGVPETFPGSPAGTRAVQLWDNRLPSYFLETFGRPERESACECARSGEPTMAQALHLMNAPEIERKISARDGRIAKLLAEGAGRDRIVEELCLTALGRGPTDKERRVAEKLFAEGSIRQASEDFLWTLLNSYDFLFAH